MISALEAEARAHQQLVNIGGELKTLEALPQATVDQMMAKIPMRRCGELQEAAQQIAWIVSPACSFTTGLSST